MARCIKYKCPFETDGHSDYCDMHYRQKVDREYHFSIYMNDVNRALIDLVGVGSNDLPDYCYADNFDAGISPEETARLVVEDCD